MPGRLAGEGNAAPEFKNGKKTFEAVLRSSCPIDIIIISLGTNDLLTKYNKKVKEIINDLEWYTNIINLYNENCDVRNKYFNNRTPEIYYIMPFDIQEPTDKVMNKLIKIKREHIICHFKEKNII